MNCPPWHVCVLIPARNEAALLPRCLESIERAVSNLNGAATADVVLVADQSTDQTVSIGRWLLRNLGTVVETNRGAAGASRFVAAEIGMGRTNVPLRRCWFANTDADCVVPPHWLTGQLALATSGFEAFAGTVSVDTFEEHDPEVPARFHASYRIHPDGSHPHIHGANLGVRADAYLECGGWAAVETGEDHDLWARLVGLRKRTHSTSSIEVVTSGRRVGRAPRGFAAALAAHNAGPR